MSYPTPEDLIQYSKENKMCIFLKTKTKEIYSRQMVAIVMLTNTPLMPFYTTEILFFVKCINFSNQQLQAKF